MNTQNFPQWQVGGRHDFSDEHLRLGNGRPEKILVINCGSSSLKYSFFDTQDEGGSAHGIVERIGVSDTRIAHSGPEHEVKRHLPKAGFPEAFQAAIFELAVRDVSVVAHRVVHGGEHFTEATVITDPVLERIAALNSLAPLHNPLNVAGIREMRRLYPFAAHIAVFDSAFHQTLPPCAYLYGLPYEYYANKGVRRYGFHGVSHHYVSLRAARFLKRRPDELRLITCHLGNGSSLCAVDHGRSVDTTMGFTPAEGLIMGTRCGDLDAGVLTFLERTEGLTASQIEDLLNRQSGLLGLSGISSDMREILKAADEGKPRAVQTLAAYCYRVRKYIGAYVAVMGGLDALIFTGGIGQGSAEVRAISVQGLDCLGLSVDKQRNHAARGFEQLCCISARESAVAVLVVPTDEERMIACEALRALETHGRHLSSYLPSNDPIKSRTRARLRATTIPPGGRR
jgi:acetate kinase